MTNPTPPARSLEQRREALRKGNRIRGWRAELKRQIAAGEASLPELILNPPADLETAKVRELLMAVPKVGPVKADAMLRSVRTIATKTFGGLTPRQREELVAELERYLTGGDRPENRRGVFEPYALRRAA